MSGNRIKLGTMVRILPTSKVAQAWVGCYGIIVNNEFSNPNNGRIRTFNYELIHYTLQVEWHSLTVIKDNEV